MLGFIGRFPRISPSAILLLPCWGYSRPRRGKTLIALTYLGRYPRLTDNMALFLQQM